MKEYSYFKNLYSNCDDSVICIDSKLNVIFATENVYAMFDTDRNSFSHISYILPMRNCYTLQDIINSSKRSSFTSRNVIDGSLYKFAVIPYPLNDDKYFLISLTAVADKGTHGLDKFIDRTLKITDKELAQNTSSIITASEGLDAREYKRVVNCVRRIRKLFDSFYTVICDKDTQKAERTIDLNRYFPFFIDALFQFIGYDKADIRFISSIRSAYVRITQQTLDIICCNIIAIIIKNSPKKKVTVSIAVDRSADDCLILFTDDNPPLLYAENEYNTLSLALIEKLTKISDGNVFVSSNVHTGNTTALRFAHYESADMLYAPEEFDTEGIFSAFAVMLSDI